MVTRLNEKKIEQLTKKTVFRILRTIFTDPDFGLELRPDFERRLRRAIASKKAGRLRDWEQVAATS